MQLAVMIFAASSVCVPVGSAQLGDASVGGINKRDEISSDSIGSIEKRDEIGSNSVGSIDKRYLPVIRI